MKSHVGFCFGLVSTLATLNDVCCLCSSWASS